MDKGKGFSPPAIGGASLLAVFAVLCLTVFALLSLTTVEADRRLAEAAAQAVADYYAADCQAQEVLARLRAGEVPEGVEEKGAAWAYQCPISSAQELAVEVRRTDWAILRWQVIPAGDWETDDRLEVWDGTLF